MSYATEQSDKAMEATAQMFLDELELHVLASENFYRRYAGKKIAFEVDGEQIKKLKTLTDRIEAASLLRQREHFLGMFWEIEYYRKPSKE